MAFTYSLIDHLTRHFQKRWQASLDRRLILGNHPTGDSRLPAKLREKKGIFRKVFLNLLPEDKKKLVGELSKQEKVCFVGDGINDLEALSSAHLSVAVLSSERGFGPTGSIHIPQDQVSNLLSWYRYFSKFERIEKWVILTGLSYNIALLAVNSTVGLSPFFVLLSFSAVSILSLSPLILLKRLSTHTVRKFSQT